MFHYRKDGVFLELKNNPISNIRLFWFVLNHPGEAVRVINSFREEWGKVKAEIESVVIKIDTAKEALKKKEEEIFKLREEMESLKRGAK